MSSPDNGQYSDDFHADYTAHWTKYDVLGAGTVVQTPIEGHSANIVITNAGNPGATAILMDKASMPKVPNDGVDWLVCFEGKFGAGTAGVRTHNFGLLNALAGYTGGTARYVVITEDAPGTHWALEYSSNGGGAKTIVPSTVVIDIGVYHRFEMTRRGSIITVKLDGNVIIVKNTAGDANYPVSTDMRLAAYSIDFAGAAVVTELDHASLKVA
jgi:hypothetical protein